MRKLILLAACSLAACAQSGVSLEGTQPARSWPPVPVDRPVSADDDSQLEDAAGRVVQRAQRTGVGLAGNAATRSARTATGNVYVDQMGGSIVRGTVGEIQRWLRTEKW